MDFRDEIQEILKKEGLKATSVNFITYFDINDIREGVPLDNDGANFILTIKGEKVNR